MNRINRIARTGGIALLALGAAIASWPASAEKNDRNMPTQWESDHFSYDDLKQVTTLEGSAIVNKGTMSLKADKIVITQDPEGFQYGVATGTDKKQAWFRQKRDAVDEFIEGSAQRIDYDSKNDRVILTGRANMKRLQGVTLADEANGTTIIYDNRTDTYQVAGGNNNDVNTPTGTRPHGVIAPRIQPSTTPPGAPKPTGSSLRPSGELASPPKEAR